MFIKEERRSRGSSSCPAETKTVTSSVPTAADDNIPANAIPPTSKAPRCTLSHHAQRLATKSLWRVRAGSAAFAGGWKQTAAVVQGLQTRQPHAPPPPTPSPCPTSRYEELTRGRRTLHPDAPGLIQRKVILGRVRIHPAFSAEAWRRTNPRATSTRPLAAPPAGLEFRVYAVRMPTRLTPRHP